MGQGHKCVFDVEEETGVFCKINKVRLFAQSAEDCEKAGGIVTHIFTKKVKAVGDTTSDDPETQSIKDK